MAASADLVRIYVADPDLVWVSATIQENSEKVRGKDEKRTLRACVTVEITDPDYLDAHGKDNNTKEVTLDFSNLLLENTGNVEGGVEDMISLNYLHEASILHNLRMRHQCSLPYTYIGAICVAVNPYQRIDMYTVAMQAQYGKMMRHELPPHVFSTSAAAYRGLSQFSKKQSILVSGESGAGKTETVKILMRHLAYISTTKIKGSSIKSKDKDKDTNTKNTSNMIDEDNRGVIDKVLQANPLLESFGNAKTIRNDNSSRFGKFTQMQFDAGSKLVGSKCLTYLLEKSRIVHQTSNERNYHIFHQLLAASDSFTDGLYMKGRSGNDFRYTSGGDTKLEMIENVSDENRYMHTAETLELLGVSTENHRALMRIISGILYLGQVVYTGDENSCQVDLTSDPLQDSDGSSLTKCCLLLGLQEQSFVKDSTIRKMQDPESGKDLAISLTLGQAVSNRDSLAKDIYSRLFLWLVSIINKSTCSTDRFADDRTISLLDIFGFESFAVNGFEQLCINFANEKLQSKFTRDCFSAVQEEYKEEGLEWEKIPFKDNADILLLFESREGLIALLNEQCLRNLARAEGQDASYVSAAVKSWGNMGSTGGGKGGGGGANGQMNQSIFMQTHRMSKTQFAVQHYAGQVKYTVEEFVAKNRDALASEMRSLMLGSSNHVLKLIFSPMDSEALVKDSHTGSGSGGSGKGKPEKRKSFMHADTVLTKFRSQLQALISTVDTTEVQYVRCIKPNSTKSPVSFERAMSVEQLRCAGMIEAIRISRAAYPHRVSHIEFLQRFGVLSTASGIDKIRLKSARAEGRRGYCGALLQMLLLAQGDGSDDSDGRTQLSMFGKNGKAYEVGNSRVYFSAGVLEVMEVMRAQLITTNVVCIQSIVRCFVHRRVYLKKRNSAVRIQVRVRIVVAKRVHTEFFEILSSAVRIQTLIRRNQGRGKYLRMRMAAIVIAARVRGRQKRRKYTLLLSEEKKRKENEDLLAKMKKRLQEEEDKKLLAQAQAWQEQELEREREREQEQERTKTEEKILQEQENENKSKSAEDSNKSAASSSGGTDGSAATAAGTDSVQASALGTDQAARERVEDKNDKNHLVSQGQIAVPTSAPVAISSNLQEIKAVEAVQSEVRRLTKMLDMALAANDSLRESALAADRVSEKRFLDEKAKQTHVGEKYKAEKALLMKAFIETGEEHDHLHNHLLDRIGSMEIELDEERALRQKQHKATMEYLDDYNVKSNIKRGLDKYVGGGIWKQEVFGQWNVSPEHSNSRGGDRDRDGDRDREKRNRKGGRDRDRYMDGDREHDLYADRDFEGYRRDGRERRDIRGGSRYNESEVSSIRSYGSRGSRGSRSSRHSRIDMPRTSLSAQRVLTQGLEQIGQISAQNQPLTQFHAQTAAGSNLPVNGGVSNMNSLNSLAPLAQNQIISPLPHEQDMSAHSVDITQYDNDDERDNGNGKENERNEREGDHAYAYANAIGNRGNSGTSDSGEAGMLTQGLREEFDGKAIYGREEREVRDGREGHKELELGELELDAADLDLYLDPVAGTDKRGLAEGNGNEVTQYEDFGLGNNSNTGNEGNVHNVGNVGNMMSPPQMEALERDRIRSEDRQNMQMQMLDQQHQHQHQQHQYAHTASASASGLLPREESDLVSELGSVSMSVRSNGSYTRTQTQVSRIQERMERERAMLNLSDHSSPSSHYSTPSRDVNNRNRDRDRYRDRGYMDTDARSGAERAEIMAAQQQYLRSSMANNIEGNRTSSVSRGSSRNGYEDSREISRYVDSDNDSRWKGSARDNTSASANANNSNSNSNGGRYIEDDRYERFDKHERHDNDRHDSRSFGSRDSRSDFEHSIPIRKGLDSRYDRYDRHDDDGHNGYDRHDNNSYGGRGGGSISSHRHTRDTRDTRDTRETRETGGPRDRKERERNVNTNGINGGAYGISEGIGIDANLSDLYESSVSESPSASESETENDETETEDDTGNSEDEDSNASDATEHDLSPSKKGGKGEKGEKGEKGMSGKSKSSKKEKEKEKEKEREGEEEEEQ